MRRIPAHILLRLAAPCLFVIAACVSCTPKKQTTPLFTLLNETGINFRNDVKDSKEDNSFLFRNFYNGGGVAVGDINNDGMPDVFLTSNQGENKIYLNKGNLKFEDISVAAGLKQDSMWSTGATMVDINADGLLDIYVCHSGHIKSGNRRNKLYVNQGGNHFREAAKEYGLDISGYCTQASFFDYDRDGDLDCFIINNSPIPFSSLNYADMRDVEGADWQVDANLKGGGNHLYQNNNSKFAEVTKEAGLHTGLISFGLGVSVSDINNDGWADIYVGNDFIEKDYLYINQKDGTFSDELEQRIQKISMSSMSTDVADINNDGHPEIFTTDMIPDDDYRLKTTGTFDNIDLYLSKQKAGLYHQYVRNCLQLNNGNGQFSEVANYTKTFGTDWSWGALFFDADNDGLNDIFVCSGIAKDVGDLDFLDFFSNDVYAKMVSTGQRTEVDELLQHIPTTPLPNRVFKNNGNLQFANVGEEWGFTQKGFSNSVAYADLDNDGDLDLILNNENGPASVYRNNTQEQTANHFLSVRLKGTKANPFAVGAKVLLYKKDSLQTRELYPVRGFQSSMDYTLSFGVGATERIDSLIVRWPDGLTATKLFNLRTDSLYQLSWNDGSAQPIAATPSSTVLLDSVASFFEKHSEDDWVDFYYERNLPAMLSREGPHIAKGDVNGDGLEDVYISGAKNQGGQLYLQTIDGGFVKKEQPVFQQYKDFEDVAVMLFDADGDKDLDLFIGAGGNNTQPGERSIEHRLYINNGKGDFAIKPTAFAANNSNISVATASDYDGDGDLDLFVGGRSLPLAYGVSPSSYLYENKGDGTFADASQKLNANLSKLGMVTGAVWADVAGDAKKELVVVGEWMRPQVFSYQSGKFEEVKNTGFENMYGWWQSVAAADLNGDGKEDLVLGNIGENFYLRPTAEHPVKLWVTDFDGNGTADQFLTQTINGKDMPVFLKREIVDQFPGLKKDNLKHSDYAKKGIQELFGEGVLKAAIVRTFNYCQSVVAINNGNGNFTIQALPTRMQLSSVNAICPADVNGDGKMDLLTGGNLFNFPPQFGRLDASYGDVLINDGKGNFIWMPNNRSGLQLRGEVKDIQTLYLKGRQYFLITQNNQKPQLYRLP